MLPMAKTTTITITDDIDSSPNAESYEFSYDGTTYSIDLSKKNKSAMDKALKPYLEVATKVSGRRSGRRGATRSSGGRRSDLGAVRDWARASGHEVSDRGRISQGVQDAYDAAL